MKIQLFDTLFWHVLVSVLWFGFGWPTQANVTGCASDQSGLGPGITTRTAAGPEAHRAVASSDQGDNDGNNQANKEAALAQMAGRVTVISPAKCLPLNSSQKQTSTQPL